MIDKSNGVTIGGKHSYNDYGLILTSKSISAPEAQKKTVEVPGRNGVIDLTEVLTGDVRFNPRTLEMQFYVIATPEEWSAKISAIQNALNGKKVKIIFDDDLNWYWLGRPEFEFSNDGRVGELKVTAEVDPYKYDITASDEDWLWDPFDFETGIINETGNIEVSGSKVVTIVATGMPAYPTITVSADMSVIFNGTTYSLSEGSTVEYDILFSEGENTLTFIGNGTVSVSYRGGLL